jgi:hypothetical protein
LLEFNCVSDFKPEAILMMWIMNEKIGKKRSVYDDDGNIYCVTLCVFTVQVNVKKKGTHFSAVKRML